MSDIHNEIYRKKTGGNQKVSDSRGSGSTQIPQANEIAYGQTNVASALDDNTGAIEAIVNVTGSKNLLTYPYYQTTKTENGITFTDNGDGTITIPPGTASADAGFQFEDSSIYRVKNGTYKFTGCPEGGGQNSYYVRAVYRDVNGNYNQLMFMDEGNGSTFTVNGDYYGSDGATLLIILYVINGTTITEPITFYPMIRDVRIKDPTFAPWAMTNRQLTESVNSKFATISGNSSSDLLTALDSLDKDRLARCVIQCNNYYVRLFYNIGNTYDFNYIEVGTGQYTYELRLNYVRSAGVTLTQYTSNSPSGQTVTITGWTIYLAG